MPASIKQQILDYVLSALEPLRVNGTVREITRQLDRITDSKVLPCLMVYDGEEKTFSRTDTVWSCRFKLSIVIAFGWQRDPGPQKDFLVAEVQKKMESDLTLGSTSRIVDAGNETPVSDEKTRTAHRTTLTYTVQYNRRIGDPYLSS
jgi:hypothetical protein